MPETAARLYLVTPPIADADADAFAPRLAEACAAGEVAAVLLRLEAADERTLTKRVKALAPAAQERGAAVLVSATGDIDLAAVAARGGADGVHVGPDPALVRDLRGRLKDRIVGAGGLRSKDDAMAAGEAGADYLMFGEPRPDGSVPPLDAVAERAAWWAEIFETPCVAFAPSLDAVQRLAATGAEFVAVGDAVWVHPEGPAAAVVIAAATAAETALKTALTPEAR
jgi:thiamine-phosphate pyrophosphorylase